MRNITIYRHYLKKTDCYNEAPTQKIVGVQLHDTGASNKWLKRFVDDPVRLGVNQYNNHWNKPGTNMTPGGAIGCDKDGNVVIYQLLPFNKRNWLSGSGNNGNANKIGYWGWEVARDSMQDEDYFNKAIKEASVNYAAYICQINGIDPEEIIDCNIGLKGVMNHRELHSCGVASNHSDTQEWFSKFGYTMDQFRRDVREAMCEGINATIIDCDKEVDPTVLFEAEVLSEKWLNLRSSPSKSAYVLAQMKHGEMVSVFEDNGEWWKVKYKDMVGYAMSEFMQRINTEPMPCEEEDEEPPAEDNKPPACNESEKENNMETVAKIRELLGEIEKLLEKIA